jgi:hypothetical protein
VISAGRAIAQSRAVSTFVSAFARQLLSVSSLSNLELLRYGALSSESRDKWDSLLEIDGTPEF